MCLTEYDFEKILDMTGKMHLIEHGGDTKKHEMTSALAKAFVTPLDREDIALISQNIDNVTDKIEEVLQRFYMNGIKEVSDRMISFAKSISECCGLMKAITEELPNFRKSKTMHDMIVGLNHKEEECDSMYLEAMRNITKTEKDAWAIVSKREIFECMEQCADACEHVGDCIETVIMKNS